jgi:hypothetical protein
VVDRHDRRLLKAASSTVGAIALGSLAVALALGQLAFAQIVAVAFVEGSVTGIFSLTEQGALPLVVAGSAARPGQQRGPAAVGQHGPARSAVRRPARRDSGNDLDLLDLRGVAGARGRRRAQRTLSTSRSRVTARCQAAAVSAVAPTTTAKIVTAVRSDSAVESRPTPMAEVATPV